MGPSPPFPNSFGGKWSTFRNGERAYMVDFVGICGKKEECGWFLRLLQNGQEKTSFPLTEIK